VTELALLAPGGVGEVEAGTDLAELVAQALPLADGDVVVITSKVVGKAEGMLREGDREAALASETVRVVAARGPVRIVENRLGLVMAAAGIDNSNVPAGRIALLPRDPDASARAIRDRHLELTGRDVAVLVADTAGRAWRRGQTDIAIGLAGLPPLASYAGRVDAHGNLLSVTEPAVADEIAGAAELAAGKLGARPFVRVRGLAHLVLPPGEHGPGAHATIRPVAEDLFALGAREAVVSAVAGEQAGAFGTPAPATDVVDALRRCGWDPTLGDPEPESVGVALGGQEDLVRLRVLAHALGQRIAVEGGRAVLNPAPACGQGGSPSP